jgi:hypothetical protein
MMSTKRYIVPAFFIVEATSEDHADDIVSDIQDHVNFEPYRPDVGLYIDEVIPTLPMPEEWDTAYTVMDMIEFVPKVNLLS